MISTNIFLDLSEIAFGARAGRTEDSRWFLFRPKRLQAGNCTQWHDPHDLRGTSDHEWNPAEVCTINHSYWNLLRFGLKTCYHKWWQWIPDALNDVRGLPLQLLRTFSILSPLHGNSCLSGCLLFPYPGCPSSSGSVSKTIWNEKNLMELFQITLCSLPESRNIITDIIFFGVK